MPSIESLGEMVAPVNLGAVNGLQTLGLVPEDLSGQALKGTVKTQFLELFREISERLSEEEKDRMGFDGVVLEHTLCKVGRFLGEGAYGGWGFKKLQKKKRKVAEVEEDEEEQADEPSNEEGSSSRKKKKKMTSRKGKEKATD